jgi:hypothetical protein
MKKHIVENINRTVPFEVPTQYFDELPMVIQSRISANHAPIFTVSWSFKRTLIAVASSVVIGFLIWVTYPSKQYTIGEETLSQVNEEAIINYLKAGDILASDLSYEANFDTNSADSTIINQLDISEQDIIKHLDSEMVEI